MQSTLKIAAAAVVLAALSVSPPAAAAVRDGAVTQQVRVAYAHADTLHEAGARRLFKQLERAAADVCTLKGSGRRHGRAFQTCRATALAAAVRDVDAPQLSAIAQPQPVVMASR